MSRRLSRESQSWKLLKYICANCGRTISAEELTRELIFAGSESNIDNTLRVRLRRARAILDRVGLGSKLDGLILYGGGKYCINPDLDVRIDVRETDSLCRRAMDKSLGAAERLELCLMALRMYNGPCLVNSKPRAYIELLRAQCDSVFRALLRQVSRSCARRGTIPALKPSVRARWRSARRMPKYMSWL